MRIAKNIFELKSSRILRVLLVKYPKTWTVKSLSNESDVSLGYTHAVVAKLLQERHIIRNERGELELLNPMRLLKGWAAFHSYQTSNTFIMYYTSEQEIRNFLEGFKQKGPEYALTVLTGALFVAPYVRPTTVHLYVKSKEDAKKWAELLKLQPTEGGGNVMFAIPPDEGIFYGSAKIDDFWVVSAVQLCVDLYNYPARGLEAAEELIKKIEQKWVETRKMRVAHVR